MLLPGDSLPGLRDLTVAVPSDLAKYLKKVTDHYGDDSRDRTLATQRAFKECLGQSSEETITRYVLLDVDEDMEKIMRYDGGVSECDNLGPAFSKNIFAAKVFHKWEPKLTSISRMANGDTKVVFYDIEELALATVVCHARNVQMRIAEETGIGLKSALAEQMEKAESEDPDL